jgi:cytochrome c oxidase assembly factor CtaG
VTTARLLLTAWALDPFALAVAVASVVAYGVYVRRLGRFDGRAAFAATAAALFALAFVSPMGVLARGYLFSAHMLQHLLLVLVVPPLALLALPGREDHARSGPGPRGAARALAWGLGLGAMWLWHAPALCDAAATSLAVQRVQTLSLLAMGGAFWWPIFAPLAARRLPPLAAIVYLFTACVGCTVLGVWVTFSPVSPCSVYARPVDGLGVLPLLRSGWGLTPRADQEVGGLLMWVPACLVYAAAILAMLARHFREEEAFV